MKPQRIIHAVDDHGYPVVRIELTNRRGMFVTVDAVDYHRLQMRGLSSRWFLARNSSGNQYVRASRGDVVGDVVMVAREIMGAGRGEVVCYRNLDRLDLRRRNLRFRRGYAPGLTPAFDEFSGHHASHLAAAAA